jgi:hypothetical protein
MVDWASFRVTSQRTETTRPPTQHAARQNLGRSASRLLLRPEIKLLPLDFVPLDTVYSLAQASDEQLASMAPETAAQVLRADAHGCVWQPAPVQ